MERYKCQHCGTEHFDKKRCPFCGAPNAPVEKAPFTTNAYNQVTIQKTKKPSKFKSFVIALLVFAIIAVGVVVFIKKVPTGDAYVASTNAAHTLNWKGSGGSGLYNVYVNNQAVGQTQQTEYDISQYLIDDAKYKLEIKSVNGNGEETLLYTVNYNYRALSQKDFQRKPQYFINGNNYDYVINSVQEYRGFVWYNILYRKNNVRCYIATEQLTRYNIESQTRSAISNYPEYDALERASTYSSFSNNVVTLVNFNYYLPTDFTKTTASVTIGEDATMWSYVRTHSQYIKNTAFNQDYITANDAGQERHFDIDTQDRQEVVVNNTEQLFMVVQYGARPVFADQTSIVAVCYNNAKQILSEINSDSLTDYQKAFNIYTYLCSRVTYDHVLLNYMTYINDYSVNTFGKFNVFYLESILYDLDKQISVCDGIAKTFTLLCQIEGINASKVNGQANLGNGSSGGHAWNRICLDDSWYIVDCTWGVASYGEDNDDDQVADEFYEAFTYAYFLISENDIADTHEAEYQIDSTPTTNYNFFKKHQVSTDTNSGELTIDLYIESDADLMNLKKYMYYSGNHHLNVQFDSEYLYSMYSHISPFESNYEQKVTQAISNKIKNPIIISGTTTYSISGWMDYGLNCFLIIGTGSNSNN